MIYIELIKFIIIALLFNLINFFIILYPASISHIIRNVIYYFKINTTIEAKITIQKHSSIIYKLKNIRNIHSLAQK